MTIFILLYDEALLQCDEFHGKLEVSPQLIYQTETEKNKII